MNSKLNMGLTVKTGSSLISFLWISLSSFMSLLVRTAFCVKLSGCSGTDFFLKTATGPRLAPWGGASASDGVTMSLCRLSKRRAGDPLDFWPPLPVSPSTTLSEERKSLRNAAAIFSLDREDIVMLSGVFPATNSCHPATWIKLLKLVVTVGWISIGANKLTLFDCKKML